MNEDHHADKVAGVAGAGSGLGKEFMSRMLSLMVRFGGSKYKVSDLMKATACKRTPLPKRTCI